jgi:hypothetical protein
VKAEITSAVLVECRIYEHYSIFLIFCETFQLRIQNGFFRDLIQVKFLISFISFHNAFKERKLCNNFFKMFVHEIVRDIIIPLLITLNRILELSLNFG